MEERQIHDILLRDSISPKVPEVNDRGTLGAMAGLEAILQLESTKWGMAIHVIEGCLVALRRLLHEKIASLIR